MMSCSTRSKEQISKRCEHYQKPHYNHRDSGHLQNWPPFVTDCALVLDHFVTIVNPKILKYARKNIANGCRACSAHKSQDGA